MKIFLVICFILVCNITVNLGQITFTNLKCGVKDGNYAEVKLCRIKAVNRTHKYIDIHVKVNELPVNNVTLNFKFMRYDGQGYKVFFIDTTFDACKFLRSPKNPLIQIFYESYKASSNINHTCPFNHDFIIDKLWTTSLRGRYFDLIRFFPIANGDYAVFTEWYTYNVRRGFLNIYTTIKAN